MKKKVFLSILLIFLCVPLIINAEDIGGGGSDTSHNQVDSSGISGKVNSMNDIGMRVTIYDEEGNRVSNSADVVFSQITYNRIIKHGYSYNTKSTNNNGKIDYLKGRGTVTWNYTSLSNYLIVEQNHATCGSECNADIEHPEKIPKYLLRDNAQYWYDHIDIRNGTYVPTKVMNALSACEGAYSCEFGKKYYAVVEPTMLVWYGGKRYYGTAYELAYTMMKNDNSTSMKDAAYRLGNVVNNPLPRTLVIGGEYTTFYNNVGITEFCSDSQTCFGSKKIVKSKILNQGVGMSVYDWTEILNFKKDISCSVNVNINECGESSIYEANYNNAINNKECIVNNAAYSYIEGCNLYCSDEITTDFNGFYSTFIGNNSLKAIKSGKYISIKSNPKITIKKTCYQSSSSNECPDVSGSFKNKLNSDYKSNKIYLNIDGKKYEFIGNSSISNNGYSSATITYEYKLDDNINKYIDIETMKGVLDKTNKTYTNEGPTIITSKSSYGKYEYNFDVSETPLNKYISNSYAIKKLVNTQSTEYNFQNTITINYTSVSGTKKNNYSSGDLKKTSCSYVKYNSDTSCICKENSCCDSVTCEEVECPLNTDGNTCTCIGKYGCYDDGKCTPIKEPSDSGDVCNPEEKTCFPNVIYRPISLVEPFPGISGDNRIPGNNWNKIYKTNDGRVYDYKNYYITQRRGYKDYEIYQAEPLYVIKLDGNTIQEIRKYNDKHSYNDFELVCVEGENCISKFLRGQTQDFSINLISSGTCKNINNYNFDSCIKNKGE